MCESDFAAEADRLAARTRCVACGTVGLVRSLIEDFRSLQFEGGVVRELLRYRCPVCGHGHTCAKGVASRG